MRYWICMVALVAMLLACTVAHAQTASSPHWPSAAAAGYLFGLGGADDATKRASYDWAAQHYDFIASVDGHYLDYIRSVNPTIGGLGAYEEFTCVIEGSSQQQAVEDHANALGRDPEDAYLHYSQNTVSSISAGYDVSNAYPWLTWDAATGKVSVPGWNPANDKNGDGYVDDAERASLVDPNATARRKLEARVVIWSWNPPRWQMNLGAFELVRVLVELVQEDLDNPQESWGQGSGYGLIMWDDILGWLWTDNKLEYPRTAGGDGLSEFQADIARLLAYSKELYGTSVLIGGNACKGYWIVDKELDVCIREGLTNTWDTARDWEGLLSGGQYGPLNPSSSYYQARQAGKLQILQHQYNLRFYIADTPDVWARDRIFGVAAYYILQRPGKDYWTAWRSTNYWPTVANCEAYWSRSLEVDIGTPTDTVPAGATAVAPWGLWVLAEGADPGHPDYPDITKCRYKVYAREYTNGLVLLKPKSGTDPGRSTFADNTATTHDLGGWYQPVLDDGTLGEPTTSVTLRNGEAAIFVGGHPTVTLQVTPGAAMPGSDATYLVTCTNPFPDPITNVKVQGRVPAGTTYLDGSARLVVDANPVDPVAPQFAPNPDDPSELFIWVIVDQITGNGGRAEFEYKVHLDAP